VSIVLTLEICATWVALGFGLFAIGLFFLNRAGELEPTWSHAYYSVWFGFGVVMAGLMVWHFFLPVDDRALVMFGSAAALALVIQRRWLTSLLRVPVNLPFAVAVIGFVLWTANHALATSFAYDDYSYEFQAVRWFHDYPLVPGLANLHGRIGFNNSHHLFAALVSAGQWRGSVNRIFNGMFIVLAAILLLDAVRDLATGTRGSVERSLFPALLVCPCVGLVLFGEFGPMLGTLKADAFVAAATLVLACLFVKWSAVQPGTSGSAVLAATTLVVGAVLASVKISALVFSGLIVAVVAVRSLRQLRLGRQRRGPLFGALVVVAVLGISVPLRGIVLSGYPFYPMTALSVNVDWRVPKGQVEAERSFIASFARLTYDPRAVSSWRWLPSWVRSIVIGHRVGIFLPLILTLVSAPLLLLSRRGDLHTGSNDAAPVWPYATLASASIISLGVWFMQAPAGRFAFAQMWILFAAVFAWGVRRQGGGWSWAAVVTGLVLVPPPVALGVVYYPGISDDPRTSAVVLGVIAFGALWIALFGLVRLVNPRLIAVLALAPTLYQHGQRSAEYILSKDYASLMSMVWIHLTPIPHRAEAVVPHQTRSGLTVYQSRTSTFETPLPNTPYFNSFLQLRTTRMKDGFRNAAPPDTVRYWNGDYSSP
jgi:hypothetical protein